MNCWPRWWASVGFGDGDGRRPGQRHVQRQKGTWSVALRVNLSLGLEAKSVNQVHLFPQSSLANRTRILQRFRKSLVFAIWPRLFVMMIEWLFLSSLLQKWRDTHGRPNSIRAYFKNVPLASSSSVISIIIKQSWGTRSSPKHHRREWYKSRSCPRGLVTETTGHFIYANVISTYKQQNTNTKSIKRRKYQHLQKIELYLIKIYVFF